MPLSPASVPSRTKSHTVRAVARIGKSSSVVTRNFGAASRTWGRSSAPAAAFAPVVRSVRRFIVLLYGPALRFGSGAFQIRFDLRNDFRIRGRDLALLTGIEIGRA